MVKAISVAAAEGDRSENAEYIYRKKELRELDRKIRFLEKNLKNVKVIQDKPKQKTKVFFGAWVTLMGAHLINNKVTYRLVGSVEVCIEDGEISIESPLAKALLGKRLNEEVVVCLPDGTNHVYEIIEIRY